MRIKDIHEVDLPLRLSVHSSFENAANLCNERFWISVLNDEEAGPLRIFLALSDFRRIFKVGANWVLEDGALKNEENYFEVPIPKLGAELREYSIGKESAELAIYQIDKFVRRPVSGTWELVADRAGAILCPERLMGREFGDSLSQLIGLGAGLSPDGDDMIYGFLASLLAVNHPLSGILIEALCEERIEKTTDIAAQAYRFSKKRLFPGRVHAFFSSLEKSHDLDLSKKISEIHEFGASSGKSILFGIRLGLELSCSDERYL